MKTRVIYDSAFGNTERIAAAITGALEEHGQASMIRADRASLADLNNIDLLVIGCPTQRHGITPRIAALLTRLPNCALIDLPVAVFDTRYRIIRLLSGSAAHTLAQRLKQRGAQILGTPESFFVVEKDGPIQDGELWRAGEWAHLVATELAVMAH